MMGATTFGGAAGTSGTKEMSSPTTYTAAAAAAVSFNAVEPTVIDDDLLKKCVQEQVKGDATEIARKEGVDPREVLSLRLDYKNILKIDNLWAYEKLTKLQLDNNIIEKIENLGFLTNLTWLDLSFNNIEVIGGLDGLTKLTDLTLFNNRISKLENMDSLINLNVLSIGNNQLADIENISYLRRFENLRLLNAAGNPLCKNPDYKEFVLAHIRNLKYLDYRLVDEESINKARIKYQDELIALEENEKIQVAQKEDAERKQEQDNVHKAAHILGIDDLYSSIFDSDPDFRKLVMASPLVLNEIKEEFEVIVQEFKHFQLKQAKVKRDELAQFEQCIDEAKAEVDAEGIKAINDFFHQKKQLLRVVQRSRDSHEIDDALRQLKEITQNLSDTLMMNEMQLVDQFEEVIKEFERNFADLNNLTLENSQTTFSRLREIENEHHEKINEEVMQAFEKFSKSDNSEADDELRDILSDKDTLTNIINGSHDFRLSKLDSMEDSVTTGMNKHLESQFQKIHDDEERRNRDRVSEIIMLVEKTHQEIDQAEDNAY